MAKDLRQTNSFLLDTIGTWCSSGLVGMIDFMVVWGELATPAELHGKSCREGR